MVSIKDEKKQKLLNICLELFLKNGMAKTTIAQITKEADIGKSTFYEYFKSKEDVINQWFEGFFTELASVDAFLSQLPSNKEKIITLVKVSCGKEYSNERFITVFVEFWRLAFSEKNERSLELINMFYTGFAQQLKTYIADGIKNKEFKECEVDKVVSNIMAMIDGHWIQYMVNQSYALEESAVYAITLFLKGISYE
jgi:AcrR family transcriptional regulator